jgi:hypothetical protein
MNFSEKGKERRQSLLACFAVSLCRMCLLGVNSLTQTLPSSLDWFVTQQGATVGDYTNTDDLTTSYLSTSEVMLAYRSACQLRVLHPC